jgi:hypothetical protein
MATPSGSALRLANEKGVGVVLVVMGDIDAMVPAGMLRTGMKTHLLETRSPRYSSAWIWGMRQMRGLTAAVVEKERFMPAKVVSSGCSKRGIASAVAGIRKSLELRFARRESTRLTLEQVAVKRWTASDIETLSDRLCDASRITAYLSSIKHRGLDNFYNVGTNDSVMPALLELGERYPHFPIYIVPGGQHGGPADAGFSRRVTIQPEVVHNLEAFCRYHFFGEGRIPQSPKISSKREGSFLVVTVRLPENIATTDNQLSWSFDRHQPYTLAFEYDEWESRPLESAGKGLFQARIAIPESVESIQYVSTLKQPGGSRPFAFSSPLREYMLD